MSLVCANLYVYFFYTTSRYSTTNAFFLIGSLNFRSSVRIHYCRHFNGFIYEGSTKVCIYIKVSTRVRIHVRFRSDPGILMKTRGSRDSCRRKCSHAKPEKRTDINLHTRIIDPIIMRAVFCIYDTLAVR